jgi:hypothetical protein
VAYAHEQQRGGNQPHPVLVGELDERLDRPHEPTPCRGDERAEAFPPPCLISWRHGCSLWSQPGRGSVNRPQG